MSENKVIWHPYPQEKPKKQNQYLISIKDNKKRSFTSFWESPICTSLEWDNYMVTAWAEMPEPFSSGKDENRIDGLLYALNDSFLKILESYDETTSKGSDCMDEAYCGGLVKGFQIALRTFGFEADEKARTITFREES